MISALLQANCWVFMPILALIKLHRINSSRTLDNLVKKDWFQSLLRDSTIWGWAPRIATNIGLVSKSLIMVKSSLPRYIITAVKFIEIQTPHNFPYVFEISCKRKFLFSYKLVWVKMGLKFELFIDHCRAHLWFKHNMALSRNGSEQNEAKRYFLLKCVYLSLNPTHQPF